MRKEVHKISEGKVNYNPVNEYFSYIQGKRDINNTSYWVKMLYKTGLKIPETFILKLTSNEYHTLNQAIKTEFDLMEKEECIELLAEKIILKMEENCFNRNQKLVFKKNFTSKIDVLNEYIFLHHTQDNELFFKELISCITEVVNESEGKINELTIQSYYDLDKRPSIQEDMVLNTRVRAFYSFEAGEVLEMVNCWDSMRIKYDLRKKNATEEQTILEIAKLEQMIPVMNQDIRSHYYFLKAQLEEKLKGLNFNGVWMIDILITTNGYYVVEMKKE